MDNLTQFTKIEQTAGRRNTVLRVITYVLLTLWALVVLFPHLSELCRCLYIRSSWTVSA